MKKFLVLTVLALFLALPVMATTDWDFTANGDVTISAIAYRVDGLDTTSTLVIVSGAKAESIEFNSGTFKVTDAATSTFQVYSSSSAVKAIKIASTSYTSCTLNDSTGAVPVTIASSTDSGAVFTISLATLAHTVTYNNLCGAASCDSGYTVTGSGASAVCSGTSSYFPVSSGGGGGASTPTTVSCTEVTYNDWGTCTAGWQNRTVKSQSPSGCTLTTAQDNDKKKSCTATTETTTTEETTSTETTTTETTATPAATAAAQQIQNIIAEAATVAGQNTAQIVAAVGATQDAKAEATAETKYTTKLISGLKNISEAVKDAITNFVNYGTPTTKILGAGERAGVINSYKSAFGKVPSTAAEWSDAIKIANGRWPSQTNATAESQAKIEFKKVYLRSANMSQANDNAAVTVIAYGLRPTARNLNSEKAAIKSFKAIYGHAPVSALAWDIVRAIAYSGAKR